MASETLQRYAPEGAVSGGSALQGTIVFIPSRTIVSKPKQSIVEGMEKENFYLNPKYYNRFYEEPPCRIQDQWLQKWE